MAIGVFHNPGRSVRSGGPEETFWEDDWNGLSSLSGIRHPVGLGIRAANERRRIIIPEEAANQSALFGVQGLYGIGLAGSP